MSPLAITWVYTQSGYQIYQLIGSSIANFPKKKEPTLEMTCTELQQLLAHISILHMTSFQKYSEELYFRLTPWSQYWKCCTPSSVLGQGEMTPPKWMFEWAESLSQMWHFPEQVWTSKSDTEIPEMVWAEVRPEISKH